MKTVSITLLDQRASAENPIKPRTVVVPVEELIMAVVDYLDCNHTLVINHVATSIHDLEELPPFCE